MEIQAGAGDGFPAVTVNAEADGPVSTPVWHIANKLGSLASWVGVLGGGFNRF